MIPGVVQTDSDPDRRSTTDIILSEDLNVRVYDATGREMS